MKDQKRQKIPPGLYVVATPIGNLGDLTQRAREVLEAADGVYCEDTRRTRELYSALGLSPPRLESLEGRLRIERALEETWAVVSDAGTPAVSDPGAGVVADAREKGVRIVPVPGVSAVTALMSVAGWNEVEFGFRGFFPRTETEVREELTLLKNSGVDSAWIWFESPKRILETLRRVAQSDPSTRMIAAKELTKLYEVFFTGSAPDVLAQVEFELKNQGEIGEWCFALRFSERSQPPETWEKTLECLLAEGVSVSSASKRVSQAFGVSKKAVYSRALELESEKNSKPS